MPERMTKCADHSYQGNLDVLADFSRTMLMIADAFDVPAMRSTCGQMEALAPVMEPTAYMRGGAMNLRDQAAFLAAVDEFVTALRKLDRRPTEA